MFSLLLPLITAPFLSRTVGQHGVGLYSYSWNISYVFVLIGTLGLENYGVRALSRVRDDPKELNRVFSSVYTMQLLWASFVLLIYLGYVFAVAGEERQISLALTFMSVSCLVNVDWALMGLDRFRPIALRNTCVKLLAAAAVFLLVRSPADLWIYGLVWSSATLIGCISCFYSLRHTVSFRPAVLKDAFAHFRPCATLFLSVLAVSVYRTMDKVMVGAISGMAQNGLYENAEKIVYCLSGFISAFGTVMLPRASHLLENGKKEDVLRGMELSMHLILPMTLAMAFGLASVSSELCPLFYGEEFIGSGLLMAPLGLSLVMIGFANVIRTQWILPSGKGHVLVRSVMAGACVNLIMNLTLIPRMQAMGAVIGTLAAELTVPIVQYLHVRRDLNYRAYMKALLLYLIPAAAMYVLVRLVPDTQSWPNLILRMACGALFFGLCLLLVWKRFRPGMLRTLLGRGRRKKTAG